MGRMARLAAQASRCPQKTPLHMAEQLKAVKGMNDILPPESARWEWLEDAVRRVMRR